MLLYFWIIYFTQTTAAGLCSITHYMSTGCAPAIFKAAYISARLKKVGIDPAVVTCSHSTRGTVDAADHREPWSVPLSLRRLKSMVAVDHQPTLNCRRASQRALMKSPVDALDSSIYSWTRRRQISHGWLQVVDSTNCRWSASSRRFPITVLRNLGILIDSYVSSMRSHVTRLESTRFSDVLRQFRIIHH